LPLNFRTFIITKDSTNPVTLDYHRDQVTQLTNPKGKQMSIHNNYDFKSTRTILTVWDDAADAAAAAQAAADAADAALQARIDAAVTAATSGLKAKNTELLGKMAQANDRVKAFEGLDPVALKELKDRLDADDDTKLLAAGKKNEVIDKYTTRMRAEHDAQLEAERDRTRAEAARADAWKGSVLDNQIRAVTSGLHKGAVEDALLHARNIFSLDAKGNAVKLDAEGRAELGKDGASPFSPAEWIETMKELKPHWFPMSTSGSGGGADTRGGSGAGKVLSRANFDKLPGAEQHKVILAGTKIVD
jgi:hypothetical protein